MVMKIFMMLQVLEHHIEIIIIEYWVREDEITITVLIVLNDVTICTILSFV
jgi:hypothetical protein